MLTYRQDYRGMSLLEVIVAMAVFGLIAASMVSMSLGSFGGIEQGGEQTVADALAQEGIEAVRAIRDRAWNEIRFATSSIVTSTNGWNFDGENTTETIGEYTRTISFEDVCRDATEAIVVCPGEYTDVQTKKVSVVVSWQTGLLKTNTVERYAYITNWDSHDWVQTDWSGGSGQVSWADETQYSTDDGNIDVSTVGQVSLASQGGNGCGTNIWPFTNANNYSYPTSTIEVSTGTASLVNLGGGGGASGVTVNQGFDVDSANWTYVDWEESGGKVAGSHTSAGGNPGGYVSITIDETKNNTLSGYWEQPFVTTVDNPTIATTSFDWIIDQFDGTFITSFQVYVFIDSAAGAPTVGQEVWSSGEINAASAWTSVPDIDITNSIGAAGTYYIKVAARIVYGGGGGPANGQNIIGFDNVGLSWQGNGGASYSNAEPAIFPTASYQPTSVSRWTSFGESATKNGGEIYYQLSDDGGLTWQYWTGANWTDATLDTQYNIATDIHANISSFSTSTGQILFKAFLSSDGSQRVQLDEVRLGCSQSYAWSFDAENNYVYPTSSIEVSTGTAHLVGAAGVGNSGSTSNNSFFADAANWTFGTWNVGGGDVTPTGSWVAGNGNPDGHVEITIPSNAKNNRVGGYYEQAINITENNATVTCSFDWNISEWVAANGVDDYQVYIFLDTAAGEPNIVNAIWSSGIQGGVSAWSGQQDIDCSGVANIAGTYYYKVAVWLDANNKNTGPITAGFDNASVQWVGAGGGVTYPSNGPSIYPTASFAPGSVDAWSGFAEVATKNGGQIYYQLSDDDGASWKYWDGAAWVTSTLVGQYTTALDVDSNIGTFSTTTNKLMFRAFLVGDGSQYIALDSITISYGEGAGGGGGYAPLGVLTSSAFDMRDLSPVQVISWEHTTPVCVGCAIVFEVRTAPDSGGLPGVWGAWYGAAGVGSTFSTSTGNRIPIDLNFNQWMQYRVQLSGDGVETPILTEVILNYK